MKYTWLVVVAGCASGWKQKTPEPEPASDSRTEYESGELAEEAPPPTIAAKKLCVGQANAATAGVTISVSNSSTFTHDLCVATDHSLGLLPNLTGLAGFELEVTLHEVKKSGAHVTCRISVGVRATTTAVGMFDQVVTAKASSTKPADLEMSKRDCVDANIDDLVRQRAVPAIKRHAAAPVTP